jgi:hypothetical protein
MTEPSCNMMMNTTAHSWRFSLVLSALSRTTRLLAFGFLGWLWLYPRVDSAGRATSLVVALSLAGFVGGTWYLARIRAESRWRAALDRYVEQELEQETSPDAGPQSKGW